MSAESCATSHEKFGQEKMQTYLRIGCVELTKSGRIQKKLQKTPSEKRGVIVSSAYLWPLHSG
jgi:hypothetical protein